MYANGFNMNVFGLYADAAVQFPDFLGMSLNYGLTIEIIIS
jgi:hypothetical protein